MLKLVTMSLYLCCCVSEQQKFTGGAVAADHPIASQVGVNILKSGGNAVDAAVATSFALSVVRPFSCGIGGGGFMVIDSPDMEPVALNYRETAPTLVGPTFFKEHSSRFGGTAVGVPGTVAGLLIAHKRYGTLTREQVLAPSIELAKKGFIPDKAYANALRSVLESLDKNPEHRSAASGMLEVFNKTGRVMLTGQADVLQDISSEGKSAFYEGNVANAIVQATDHHLSLKDLQQYKPRWEKPLTINIGDGMTIVSMPPPSSGGIAIGQIIGLLLRIGGDKLNRNDELYSHLLVESMKHAFADRAEHLADAAFVDVPVDGLLDKVYLDSLAKRIDKKATSQKDSYGSVSAPPDDDGTSHLCVVDSDGMTVAVTETINTSFGSLVLVAPFDFILNNEMDDFSSPSGTNVYGLRQSNKNLPAHGKRPLSSMSPTIVERDGIPILVLGASGGPRIITSVLQVLLNILWFDDEPVDAVERTRVHHQWLPECVYFEESTKDLSIELGLRSRGHTTADRVGIGVVQVIEIDDGILKPACDPRKGGQPAGIFPLSK